jgi:DnaJ domain/Transmembrane Fragile-X-F protein
MEYFICCFRSCLKGKDSERNNKEYYTHLGLQDTGCSAEEIKKAFKRKSLELHPDKIAQRGSKVTPEDSHRFLKMKEAFDCLSDPKRRRYYDEFGEGGLKIVESTQQGNALELLKNFQNNKLDCAFITFFIFLFFVFVLALPILFCLKTDGNISTPWVIIWTPMWIIDAILLVIACLSLFCSIFDSKDPDDKKDKEAIVSKLYFFVRTILFISIQVLVILKLDGDITLSWMNIFISWFIFEAMTVVNSIPAAVAEVIPPDYSGFVNLIEDPEEQKIMRIQIDNEYHEKGNECQ